MSGPVPDWIGFNARRRPQHLALADLSAGRRFTYAAMNKRVNAAAGFLLSQGISKGDRVAVLARNSSDQVELLFACKRIGAIFVPLNWRLALPELRYIVGDAQPQILFAADEFAESAKALAAEGGFPVLTLRDGAADSGYEQGLEAAGNAQPPHAELTHDDPWVLIYTSGSTGKPKGVDRKSVV